MTSSVYLDLALVALLAAAFWAAPALARPTLPFGVRVPAARTAEPAIVRAHQRYARGVLAAGALAFVSVAFASAALRWGSAAAFAAPILAVVCSGLGCEHTARSPPPNETATGTPAPARQSRPTRRCAPTPSVHSGFFWLRRRCCSRSPR
ncbi:hypothetical protein [Amycolatopsis orientalis]|uniref:hypothetical protein n=1 Tax=Amycolatopsis orientalis TaxID=31958 RepID=UPI0003A8851F|nr:hypothetical protein [Amycolatopsis orientalis]